MSDYGGFAYPRPASKGYDQQTGDSNKPIFPQRGMTLRDWFAGQALNGFLSNGLGKDAAVRSAYIVADNMLEDEYRGVLE